MVSSVLDSLYEEPQKSLTIKLFLKVCVRCVYVWVRESRNPRNIVLDCQTKMEKMENEFAALDE